MAPLRDMDKRVVRIPARDTDCVRVAPGTDMRPLPQHPTDHGPLAGLLIAIVVALAVAVVLVLSVLGMAGAL